MGNPATPARTVPIGIVLRRMPGATRWVRHTWRAVAAIPGAGPASPCAPSEGDSVEIHAATLTLALWRSDTEAYRVALAARSPSLFVVLRPAAAAVGAPRPVLVTASPYEAQDYADSADDVVEPVPMPPAIAALLSAFCREHHEEEAFVKRRRDRARVDRSEEGVGDARIRQAADVYRAPAAKRGAA